ncbi:MAG TPA: CPBP family intramembrane metalloprotease domain-containing protein [Parvularcula sp.]|nr:CPBP family intramembrane metalloprotease domain-containing protein [Parvularcula sp.]HBS30865.1 CPBP family intramembrane metalloprotease domain-containing protein [Parvularcula sp.]HBS36589.1 CPBP family intramembrane metalloprotease domain-containing protein [Parvularcula sp.]
MKTTSLFSQEPAKGWVPWGALAPFLLIFFVAAPVLLTDEPFMRWGLVDDRGDPIGAIGLYAFLLIPFAMTGALVLAWVLFVERRPLRTIGLTPGGGAMAFARGLGIGVATIGSIVAAIWAAGGYLPRGFAGAFIAPQDLISIGILFLCFAVQAGVEEIIFRGWLMSALARKFNVALAVILTCAVFTFLHYSRGQEPLITVGVFMFSFFACLWALKARNIWGVMGWHIGWNWLLATGFELPVTGFDASVSALLVKLEPHGPDFLTGGSQGPEGSVISLIFFVGASSTLLWRLRNSAQFN